MNSIVKQEGGEVHSITFPTQGIEQFNGIRLSEISSDHYTVRKPKQDSISESQISFNVTKMW